MNNQFDQIIDRQNTNALAFDGYESYLFGPNESFPKIKYSKQELISMWVADMQFAAPPCAIEAMKQRLEHPIFGYTMNFSDELYQVFGGWCKNKYDWDFPQEEMQVSLGVIPALIGLVEYICEPGEKVLAFTPSYGFFKLACMRVGREFITSKLKENNNEYNIDFEDFEKKASDPKTRLLLLCHPHNPVGRIWTNDELKQIGNICFKYNMKIVSDEIHCDLLRKGLTHTPLAKLFPGNINIVTCMAVSKTFNLAGLMVATIIIPDPELRKDWMQKQYSLVNPMSLAAAVGVYREGVGWLEELKDYLDANFSLLQDFLKTNFPKIQFKIPQATYLAWVDFTEYFPPNTNLTKFFLENSGVILEGSEMFVENGGLRVRLNLACPRSQIQLALDRMKQALINHTPLRSGVK
ncbi:MAG: putative C-S lyase [Bdellovibrionaceae bacterium]|nr:putative C-S lyase [Pseudobdellovibrionaceae bacterium]